MIPISCLMSKTEPPISGLAYINAVAVTKITKRLASVDNCAESGDDFQTLLAVHKDFEKW